MGARAPTAPAGLVQPGALCLPLPPGLGSLQLCSLPFCCSPVAFAKRQRPSGHIPGSSDHLHHEMCKDAAKTVMVPVGTVLLSLTSQAEVKLCSRK